MSGVSSKDSCQLILDFTFIRNHFPENVPVSFRTKHTKGFLELFHPNTLLSKDVLLRMEKDASTTRIWSEQYKEKLDQYSAASGVALHHIIIATQETCTVCGCCSKPDATRSRSILVYTSLGEEPCQGIIIPSRCIKSKCRHRGNYGWDIVPTNKDKKRVFKPLERRHCLPYWVCSTDTAFVTTMVSKDILSQVLWNHAACLNMANQGNWQLGHTEKLIHEKARKSKTEDEGMKIRSVRLGIQRKQLQRALLEYLYHRTVISLGGNTDLLSCRLPPFGRKPDLKDVVFPKLDKFIALFHDRWYLSHKNSQSDVPGHGIFEMYDGNWKMVRPTCAVDWCGVIDVGKNRTRRSFRNTPAYNNAFCSSCLRNRATTEHPADVQETCRLDFVAELQRMKYLSNGQYFIEAVQEVRVSKTKTEVKVK